MFVLPHSPEVLWNIFMNRIQHRRFLWKKYVLKITTTISLIGTHAAIIERRDYRIIISFHIESSLSRIIPKQRHRKLICQIPRRHLQKSLANSKILSLRELRWKRFFRRCRVRACVCLFHATNKREKSLFLGRMTRPTNGYALLLPEKRKER